MFAVHKAESTYQCLPQGKLWFGSYEVKLLTLPRYEPWGPASEVTRLCASNEGEHLLFLTAVATLHKFLGWCEAGLTWTWGGSTSDSSICNSRLQAEIPVMNTIGFCHLQNQELTQGAVPLTLVILMPRYSGLTYSCAVESTISESTEPFSQ